MTGETEIDPKIVLARLDERTLSILNDLTKLRLDLRDTVDTISDRVKDVESRVNMKAQEIEDRLDTLTDHVEKNYVKKTEFSPIKLIVYGFVGLVLTAFVGVLITQVFKEPPQKAPTIHLEKVK